MNGPRSAFVVASVLALGGCGGGEPPGAEIDAGPSTERELPLATDAGSDAVLSDVAVGSGAEAAIDALAPTLEREIQSGAPADAAPAATGP